MTNQAEIRGEGQLLQTLVAHWIHEDQLYWLQVRHLLIFEFAVLSAMFALRVTWLSFALMIVASYIVVWNWSLAKKIRQNRDSNVDTIAFLSKNVMSTETQKEVIKLIGSDEYEKWGALRIARHDLNLQDAGMLFQTGLFVLCFLVNLYLALSIFLDLRCGMSWLSNLHPHLTFPIAGS